jgi:ubiquinone/menaquinone biosynthesis C-methylase UbiE
MPTPPPDLPPALTGWPAKLIEPAVEAVLYDWHNGHVLRNQARDVAYWCEELPAGTVLVVGAGTGRVAAGLVMPQRRVVGLDLNLTRVRHARQRSDGLVEYLAGDARCLPVGRVFDAVLFPYSTIHLLVPSDVELVMREATRVLVPGGVLCLDMSLGFRDKPERAWHQVIDGTVPEFGQRVIEWQRHRRTPGVFSVDWAFGFATERCMATKTEEWHAYDVADLGNALAGQGFGPPWVATGYGADTDGHRRLVTVEKR